MGGVSAANMGDDAARPKYLASGFTVVAWVSTQRFWVLPRPARSPLHVWVLLHHGKQTTMIAGVR